VRPTEQRLALIDVRDRLQDIIVAHQHAEDIPEIRIAVEATRAAFRVVVAALARVTRDAKEQERSR
jgi:hypothetical protein